MVHSNPHAPSSGRTPTNESASGTDGARLSRRDYLKQTAAAALGAQLLPAAVARASEKPAGENNSHLNPKTIAAIVTEYRPRSHGDVLIGKILEGWNQDGGPGPALKLSALYVDQFPDEDLARGLSKKHGVPIFDTIEQAVTVGGDRVAVDGVISVGEHGDYPWNDKGQHLYPRRRFFREISDAFAKHGRVVPVFSDKHLGPQWEDGKWIYDRARQMKIPFMAGSSLPVSFRKPNVGLPMDCEVEAAVGVGYSGLDIYGAHTLDCFQCLLERRRGAESGVRWVQCLEGDALWQAVDAGLASRSLLEAALAVTPTPADGDPRSAEQAALFLFEYRDGLSGAVFMLPGFAAGISAAVKLKGVAEPVAVYFEERTEPRHPHFAYLLKAIERMMHTGEPSYPVERTLLTSGILDRALTSRAEGNRKLMTPELAIRYRPVDYPHAPQPALSSSPLAPLPAG